MQRNLQISALVSNVVLKRGGGGQAQCSALANFSVLRPCKCLQTDNPGYL